MEHRDRERRMTEYIFSKRGRHLWGIDIVIYKSAIWKGNFAGQCQSEYFFLFLTKKWSLGYHRQLVVVDLCCPNEPWFSTALSYRFCLGPKIFSVSFTNIVLFLLLSVQIALEYHRLLNTVIAHTPKWFEPVLEKKIGNDGGNPTRTYNAPVNWMRSNIDRTPVRCLERIRQDFISFSRLVHITSESIGPNLLEKKTIAPLARLPTANK